MLLASLTTSGLLTVDYLGNFITSTMNNGPIPANTFMIVGATSKTSSPSSSPTTTLNTSLTRVHSQGSNSKRNNNNTGQGPEPIYYGKPVRLQAHPDAVKAPYNIGDSTQEPPQYLCSVPVALTTSLQNKTQRLSLSTDPSADTLWVIEPLDIEQRIKKDGNRVMADEEVCIRHVVTGQRLSSYIGEKERQRDVLNSSNPMQNSSSTGSSSSSTGSNDSNKTTGVVKGTWPVHVNNDKPVGRRHGKLAC